MKDAAAFRTRGRIVEDIAVRPQMNGAMFAADGARRHALPDGPGRPCGAAQAGQKRQNRKAAMKGLAQPHQPIRPPSPFIISTKPGKLVAIISGSSTDTGCSAARPRTRWLMAMR